MKYVRFSTPEGGSWGQLDGDLIRELDGPPYLAHKETGRTQPARYANLLAPVTPTKVLGVMMNYAGLFERISSAGSELPPEPSGRGVRGGPNKLRTPESESVPALSPRNRTPWRHT